LKYVYAALLLHSSSKEINEENMKKVLASAGIKVEDARVKALTAALSEVDIEEAIKTTATVAAPQPAAQPAAQEGTATEEKKKEAPKGEEKKEEEALEGLGSLFG
jgi:large subunit ribosomal protein L12